MIKNKLYQEPWKEFARKYLSYTPPVAPSKDDIKHIEFYLKKISKKNPKILILGCTVGLRKLFSKYGLKIDLVDVTPQMFMHNPKTLKKLKRKEKFIHANWLDMRLKKKYDLIVGDFVINNFPLRQRGKFLRNVKRHLEDNGLFITRILFQPKRKLSEKAIVDNYKNKPLNMKTLTEISWDFTFYPAFNRKNCKAYNRRAFLAMKKALSKNSYFKNWIKTYEDNFPTQAKYWTLLPFSEQNKEFKKVFKIIDIRYSKNYHDCEYCPIYILKK